MGRVTVCGNVYGIAILGMLCMILFEFAQSQYFDSTMDDKTYLDNIQTMIKVEVKETKSELLTQAKIVDKAAKRFVAAQIKENLFIALRVLAERELRELRGESAVKAKPPAKSDLKKPKQDEGGGTGGDDDDDSGGGGGGEDGGTTRRPNNIIPQVANLVKAVFGGNGNINLTSYVESASKLLPRPIGNQVLGFVKLLAHNPRDQWTTVAPKEPLTLPTTIASIVEATTPQTPFIVVLPASVAGGADNGAAAISQALSEQGSIGQPAQLNNNINPNFVGADENGTYGTFQAQQIYQQQQQLQYQQLQQQLLNQHQQLEQQQFQQQIEQQQLQLQQLQQTQGASSPLSSAISNANINGNVNEQLLQNPSVGQTSQNQFAPQPSVAQNPQNQYVQQQTLGGNPQTEFVQGQIQGQPGQIHGQPGQIHGQPGQIHGQPGQIHGQPGQIHGPPGQIHIQPGQIQSSAISVPIPVTVAAAPTANRTVPPVVAATGSEDDDDDDDDDQEARQLNGLGFLQVLIGGVRTTKAPAIAAPVVTNSGNSTSGNGTRTQDTITAMDQQDVDLRGVAESVRNGLGDLVRIMPDLFKGAREGFRLIQTISQVFGGLGSIAGDLGE